MRHPNWEERRRTLARDPLATVDGFRVMMLLVMRHLFGLNVCLNCPSCNCRATPCQDVDGSNASTVGGVFGRCDAAYVAIEFQKSAGSPHGHAQLFVQCLHQHGSLQEIFAIAESNAAELREAYLRYNEHVRRSVYGREPAEMENILRDAETRWPEYKTETHLINRPSYQTAVMADDDEHNEAGRWAEAYLRDDVFRLQVLKQHHVHLPDEATGERKPQSGCYKADNPQVCKHGYPKTSEISDESAVMCPCRLSAMDLPTSGRRNALCSLHGPRDDGYLNGTHPALLAFVRSRMPAHFVQARWNLARCESSSPALSARRMPKRATVATTVRKHSQWHLESYANCSTDTNVWPPRRKHVVSSTKVSDI